MPSRTRLQALKAWAGRLKRDVLALWLGARDPQVPLSAKVVGGIVAAYALSPVDLIPDFIPVLGYLDDLVIVPVGILLAVRLIPPPVLARLRDEATRMQARPVSRAGLVAIILIWLATAALLVKLLLARA
ncbi:YkvA family protein [Xanthobacter autotrophicus DSM 431]|uniref:YkvA family protein n=1 Tax=Xanthobacter nonsaccharivorans TaxID=3119912 RepID=UPI00372C08D3